MVIFTAYCHADDDDCVSSSHRIHPVTARDRRPIGSFLARWAESCADCYAQRARAGARRAPPGPDRASRRRPARRRRPTARRRARAESGDRRRSRRGSNAGTALSPRSTSPPIRSPTVTVDAQFLGKLAGQRDRVGLPRLDLSAGQLPLPGEFRRAAPSGGEHPTVLDDGGGDDHQLFPGGQRDDAEQQLRARRTRRRGNGVSGAGTPPGRPSPGSRLRCSRWSADPACRHRPGQQLEHREPIGVDGDPTGSATEAAATSPAPTPRGPALIRIEIAGPQRRAGDRPASPRPPRPRPAPARSGSRRRCAVQRPPDRALRRVDQSRLRAGASRLVSLRSPARGPTPPSAARFRTVEQPRSRPVRAAIERCLRWPPAGRPPRPPAPGRR